MKMLSLLSIAIVAGLMFRQDLRGRAISWPFFPLLLMAVLWWGWEGMRQWGLSIGVNMAFLAGNLLLTLIWFSAKKINPKELLSTYIGVGDLLLFSILALVLPYSLFIPFHILSLLAGALLGASVFRHSTVPLAGIQALLLFVLLCSLQCLQLTFSDLEFLML